MNKFLLLALISLSAFCFTASAQDQERYASPRLDNAVNRLKGQTVDLADRASEYIRGNRNNSRNDIESAMTAHQLDASVGFLQEMLRDGHRASDLRDAVAVITDLARRGGNTAPWREVQNSVNEVSRELGTNNGGGGYGGDGGYGGGGGQREGKVFWRGTVDKEVQLIIRDRTLQTRTVSGTPYGNGTFNFTSALPSRNVNVNVVKRGGRGSVRVLQQPSSGNDYTAIIQVFDDGSGAREYQLEISW